MVSDWFPTGFWRFTLLKKKIQGFSVLTFSLKTMDFDVQHQKLLQFLLHWKDNGMSRVEVSEVKTADEKN